MNMQNLMAQAQRMQKDLEKKKTEINKMTFTGKNGFVEVVLNGNKEMVSIKIENENIDDVEMLEDMIMLAMKDAMEKVNKEIDSKFGSLGAGLGGLF